MLCNIRWSNDPPNVWEEHYEKVNNPNFLQSYVYGVSQIHLNGQKPRYGIIEIDGKKAGILQVLEVSILKYMIHAVILDRGPLWFKNYGTDDHFSAFLEAFRKEFPKRWGRKIRLIPEIAESETVKTILKNQGFKRIEGSLYQTSILNIDKDVETRRKNLKKRWRNTLTKAEKHSLEIQWDDKGQHLKSFLKSYIHDRATKGYDGPSVKAIQAFAQYAVPRREMLIGQALHKGEAIGAVLIFCHGRGATYQIGWNTDKGRDKGAHYVLLWDALEMLKKRKISFFDLGGMNDGTAKNVKLFKEGLGGRTLSLPGIYTY